MYVFEGKLDAAAALVEEIDSIIDGDRQPTDQHSEADPRRLQG